MMSIAISLLTEPESLRHLKEFYRKANPPGFWRPVAIDCDLSPQESITRLWNALLATFLAALSVFFILTGARLIHCAQSKP